MKKVCINLQVENECEARKVAEIIMAWWDTRKHMNSGDKLELDLNQPFLKSPS